MSWRPGWAGCWTSTSRPGWSAPAGPTPGCTPAARWPTSTSTRALADRRRGRRPAAATGCCPTTWWSGGSRPAPAGFDARFAAIWRRYVYRLAEPSRPGAPAVPRTRSPRLRVRLDLDRLNAAAADAARAARLRRVLPRPARGRRRSGPCSTWPAVRVADGSAGRRDRGAPYAPTPSATRWCGRWSARWSRSAAGRRDAAWLAAVTAARRPRAGGAGAAARRADPGGGRLPAGRRAGRRGPSEAADAPRSAGTTDDLALLQRRARPGPSGGARSARPSGVARSPCSPPAGSSPAMAWTGARPCCCASRRRRPERPGCWTWAAATGRSRWPSPSPAPARRSTRSTSTSGRWRSAGTTPRRSGWPIGSGCCGPSRSTGRPATTRSGPTRRSGSARRPCTSCCSPGWPGSRRPGVARLVVAKNLGADTLQRWLTEQGYAVERTATSKGFRVLVSRASVASAACAECALQPRRQGCPSAHPLRDRLQRLRPAALEQPAAPADADPEHDQSRTPARPPGPGRPPTG